MKSGIKDKKKAHTVIEGNDSASANIVQNSRLLLTPLDVLALIMAHATPTGKTFGANTSAVCHQFQQATDLFRFTKYRNKHLRQDSIEKIESEREACIDIQDDEVDYLFSNKLVILRITQNSPTVIACFKKLDSCADILDDTRRFLIREDIIFQINTAIIDSKLQKLQLEKSFGVLDLGACCLTRFPGKIIRDPKYKHIFDFLVELRLNSNYLLSLPPEIGELTTLRNLILSNNRIQSLPPEIKKLTGLHILSLYNNQLNILVAEIGELSALQTLLLDNNKLEDLPSQIGKLGNLKKLDLTKNKLKILPDEIGNLSLLQILCLADNELQSLPQKFTELILLELVLDNNYLESLPENLKADILFNSNYRSVTKDEVLASQRAPLRLMDNRL